MRPGEGYRRIVIFSVSNLHSRRVLLRPGAFGCPSATTVVSNLHSRRVPLRPLLAPTSVQLYREYQTCTAGESPCDLFPDGRWSILWDVSNLHSRRVPLRRIRLYTFSTSLVVSNLHSRRVPLRLSHREYSIPGPTRQAFARTDYLCRFCGFSKAFYSGMVLLMRPAEPCANLCSACAVQVVRAKLCIDASYPSSERRAPK